MKRLFLVSLVIVVALILILGGCSKSTPAPSPAASPTQTQAPPPSQPLTSLAAKPSETPQYGGTLKILSNWKPVNMGVPPEPGSPL
jgi:hypothetical protein